MSRNLRLFTQAVYTMDAVVQRTPSDAWDNPSPCEGWTARDVVAHQVGVLDSVTDFAGGGAPRFPETPTDASDPVALWKTCRDDLLAALDQDGALHHRDAYWFGEMSVDDLIGIVQWDPMTHAWDLGRAVGIEPHIDPDQASLNMERVNMMGDNLRALGLIGEPIEIGDDADAVSRYLASVGRQP